MELILKFFSFLKDKEERDIPTKYYRNHDLEGYFEKYNEQDMDTVYDFAQYCVEATEEDDVLDDELIDDLIQTYLDPLRYEDGKSYDHEEQLLDTFFNFKEVKSLPVEDIAKDINYLFGEWKEMVLKSNKWVSNN